jgi:hypothetical protein
MGVRPLYDEGSCRMYPPESPPAFMYTMVVPDFGGRTTWHPEELLTGTGDDVVVVGGVVDDDEDDEAEAAPIGTASAAVSPPKETSPESAPRRQRRARLS